jgi:hypothetical protein
MGSGRCREQQITLGDDARIPGGYTVQEVRDFLAELGGRLGRMAWVAR